MPFSKLIEVAESVAAGGSSRQELADCLARLVADKVPLDNFISWSKEGYTRTQLYKSENLEVVVTCWESKQDSAPHDHGGSWGMIVPYDGQIFNRMYEAVKDNQAVEIAPVLQTTGEVLTLEAEGIHQVACATEEQEFGPHVSLHVYFPPIQVMNEYVPITVNQRLSKAQAV